MLQLHFTSDPYDGYLKNLLVRPSDPCLMWGMCIFCCGTLAHALWELQWGFDGVSQGASRGCATCITVCFILKNFCEQVAPVSAEEGDKRLRQEPVGQPPAEESYTDEEMMDHGAQHQHAAQAPQPIMTDARIPMAPQHQGIT